MKDEEKTREQLITELATMRRQVAELEAIVTRRRRVGEYPQHRDESLASHPGQNQFRGSQVRLHQETTGRKRAREALRASRRLTEAELRTLNAELERRVMDRTRELAALYEVTAVTSGESLDLEKALDRVLVSMRCPAGSIHLVEETSTMLRMVAQQGIPPKVVSDIEAIPSGQGLVGHVSERNMLLVIRDWATDPRVSQAFWKTNFRSYIGVPMRAGGRVLGVLSVYGHAGHQVNVEGIALLASIADHLGVAVENMRLFEQIQRRMRELGALYLADEELYRHLSLDQVLQALVDVAVDIGGADKSSLLVWDDQQERLVVRTARNLHPETVAGLTFALGEGPVGLVAASGEPVVVEDIWNDPRWRVDERMQAEDIHSSMHIPIEMGIQTFGVFSTYYTQMRSFDQEDLRFFLALAQRAALAIQNARFHEQAQYMTRLEVRQRLARDLHDSVTQSLYSLTLLAETGRQLAQGGELEQVQQYLERIGQMTQQALQQMRRLVHQLRPSALEEQGLVYALQQRLEAVERRAGIQAHLMTDSWDTLALDVEDELYHIAQEALNNILKHAEATSVTIRLRSTDEQKELEIMDNGKGFEPDARNQRRGMGLTTMRERAENIGGSLTIFSTPGQGTCVKVIIQNRER